MTTSQTLKGFRGFSLLAIPLTKGVTTDIIWLLKPPVLAQAEAGVFYG